MARRLDGVLEPAHDVLRLERELGHVREVLGERAPRDRQLAAVEQRRVVEEVLEQRRQPADAVDVFHVVFPGGPGRRGGERGGVRVFRAWAESVCTYLRSAR